MNMFVFTGILWKEDNEYSALCPELDVVSQGKTVDEARENLLEAASLHLEGSFEDGTIFDGAMSAIRKENSPISI